jgi:hypothetical protein
LATERGVDPHGIRKAVFSFDRIRLFRSLHGAILPRFEEACLLDSRSKESRLPSGGQVSRIPNSGVYLSDNSSNFSATGRRGIIVCPC